MKYKTIGVLGGMGPEATLGFYSRIIKYCQTKYKAIQDTDYPPIIIYSLPLDGFDETGIKDKSLVLEQLIKGVRKLENSDCDFIVMPCNSVHLFIKELRSCTKIPILSIIDETVKKVTDKKVCLLGSETILDAEIYQEKLKDNNIECTVPESKEKITKLILEIMSGDVKNKTDVLKIIEKVNLPVVLGCTELPTVITQKDTKIKLYDTLQILAESSVEYSKSSGISI